MTLATSKLSKGFVRIHCFYETTELKKRRKNLFFLKPKHVKKRFFVRNVLRITCFVVGLVFVFTKLLTIIIGQGCLNKRVMRAFLVSFVQLRHPYLKSSYNNFVRNFGLTISRTKACTVMYPML
jgi:hypothetical protein